MKPILYCWLTLQQDEASTACVLYAQGCIINPDGSYVSLGGTQLLGATAVPLAYQQSSESVKQAVLANFISGYGLAITDADVVFLPAL